MVVRSESAERVFGRLVARSGTDEILWSVLFELRYHVRSGVSVEVPEKALEPVPAHQLPCSDFAWWRLPDTQN